LSEKLGEYLEKKKLSEEKEKFFLEQMEKASKLIEETKFEEGVQLYMSLIPPAEGLKWQDKVATIKNLVYEAREKEKRFAVESQQKLTTQEKKAREKIVYNNALDLMGQASALFNKRQYEDALNVYKESLPLLKEIAAKREIGIVEDSINQCEAHIRDLKKRGDIKQHTKDEEEKALAQQEKALQATAVAPVKARDGDEKKARERLTYNEALDLMGHASDFFNKRQYEDALNVYKESLPLLKEIAAKREIGIVEDSINQCEAHIRDLKKRGDIKQHTKDEEEKGLALREKALQAAAQDPAKTREVERMRSFGDKKARTSALVDEAMALLDKANLALKEAGSPNFVSADAKRARYNESLQAYQDAQDKFIEAGWTAEADKVKANAEGVRKERDAHVESLSKKLAASQQKYAAAQEPVVAPPEQGKVDAMSTEIMHKKLEQKQKRDAAFGALEEAGKTMEDFEKKPKILGGQLFKENEYPEIFRLYRKALSLFKEAGWINEAIKIEESLEIIRKKEQDFLIEKDAFDRSRAEKARAEGKKPQELDGRQAAALKRLQRDNIVSTKIEERKKAEKASRDEIDHALDKALGYFKKEELSQAEQAYAKAHELMVAQGWTNEAASVLDTIKMIREKRENREKLLMKIERSVDETGSYTRGVEQLSETMSMVKEQERQQSVVDKQAAVEQKNRRKVLEAQYFDVLAKAQDLLKSRDYDGAIGVYKEALSIAEELEWLSQIREVKDFIVVAEQKRQKDQLRAVKIEEKKRDEEIASQLARTSAADIVKDRKAATAEAPLNPRQREKLVGDEAYEIIDEGNRLHKAGKREETIEAYQKAIEKFKSINWGREAEAVVVQMQNVQKEIDDDRLASSKQQEAARTKQAYEAINDAERYLREKQTEEALTCYEKAIEIFESANWAKEAAMIRQQVETVKADLSKRLVADTANTEQARIDKAFSLIDEAKKFQRDKKIFKAVEFANQALEIFKGLGEKWAREIAQVQKFASELEQEKQRKEELIKKLKTGNL
jgi:tetratricopeptide (TPR) repeat protein